MAMNPLPPQAYTKDTLAKAYHWMQTQPESIREIATNPDILVGLYLKAKLNGESALERPSIQNFKSELKALSAVGNEADLTPDLTTLHNANLLASSANLLASGALANSMQLAAAAEPEMDPYKVPDQHLLDRIPMDRRQEPFDAQERLDEQNRNQSESSSRASTAALPPAQKSVRASNRNSVENAPKHLDLDTKSWQLIQEIRMELNLSSESETLRVMIAIAARKIRSL